MKRTVALILLVLLSFPVFGQDTLKIMSWNVLDYGNSTRDQYFRTVLRHVKPDVLVVQEMTSQSMMNNFLNNVLNPVFPGQFSSGVFINGPDTDNGIFFRSSKFTGGGNTAIHTALRDINEFVLYNAVAGDTIRIYSVHLKASTGFESNRAAEVDSLRKVTNALPNGKYFIVCGDYNIYRSTEPAYQKLLQDNPTDDGHFLDALNMPGQWNSAGYAPYHTQSTRGSAPGPGGGSTGGLDDRFDMVLYSRAAGLPGKIQYLPGSLTMIGNDGLHYNDSLNHVPNGVVPDSVALALYNASDHLPVSALFIFKGAGIGSEPTVQASNLGFSAVTSSSMEASWTIGNGTSRIVVARAGSPVSFAPTDGQSYPANSNFSSAIDLGSGNKAVFAGSGNTVTLTGLGSNITYHFAVYEYNGSGGTENYLITSPATGNQATLSSTYYSQGSLPPDLLSSWNSDRAGSGTQPASFTSGVPFVIQNGHVMTTAAPWSLSGIGNRIQIENGGTLQADHLVATTDFQVDDGGTYIHNAPSGSANGSSSDLPGSGSRSFGANSTVEFLKWANGGAGPVALPSGIVWGNLVINVASLGGSWNQSVPASGTFTVAGNLTIAQTGGGVLEFRISKNNSVTLQVTKDFVITGGRFDITNTSTSTNTYTLNVGGNLNFGVGATWDQNNGTLSVNFTGGATTVTSAIAGTFNSTTLDKINWTIAGGKSVQLNTNHPVGSGRSLMVGGTLTCGSNAVTGAGIFVLSPGATLIIGSPDGINAGTSLGNIRVSGGRTFDPTANYVFSGAASQASGDGFPTTVNNLSINNANGVTLSSATMVSGTLGLVGGSFAIGSNVLTLNGDIDQTSGSLSGGTSSSITIGGAGASTSLPSVTLQNLIVNRANGISLEGSVTVVGTVSVVSGTLSTGDFSITLGPSALLNESTGNTIVGNVSTTRTVTQGNNNTFGGIGCEINPAGGSPGQTTVSRRTGVSYGNQSVLRSFDIEAEVNTGLDASIVFHYDATELNGNNPAILMLWQSTDSGATWVNRGGISDAINKKVTVTNAASFSLWTAADTLHFSSSSITRSYDVPQGWNIMSVPVSLTDYRKTVIFPTATSSAFAFDQASGYVNRDTLKNGPGYWLKFPSAQTVSVTGSMRTHDTISVTTGWNLIGSTSDPIAVSAIQQVPTGIVASSFFGYLAGYVVADTLRPEHGYWVKVIQNGRLVLR